MFPICNGKEIFHDKTYHNPTDDELKNITAMYDDPEKHLGLGSGNQYKENGHDHYLEWLFKDWIGVNNPPPKGDSSLMSQLKKRGFIV